MPKRKQKTRTKKSIRSAKQKNSVRKSRGKAKRNVSSRAVRAVSVKRKTADRNPKKNRPVGTVTHFFRKAMVGVVRFRVPVSAGVIVRFRGATTNFAQKLSSLQYNHKPLVRAPKGKEVGVKLIKRVRGGDGVYFE